MSSADHTKYEPEPFWSRVASKIQEVLLDLVLRPSQTVGLLSIVAVLWLARRDTMPGRAGLIIAGLRQNVTAACIRLLSDPALESEKAAAPMSWSSRNFEVVFGIQIISDKAWTAGQSGA